MNSRNEESEIILSSLFNSFKNWNGYLSSPCRHNWDYKIVKNESTKKRIARVIKRVIV